MNPEIRIAIVDRLWPADGNDLNTYVVLDAARKDQIYGNVMSSCSDWVCLYSGDIPPDLARVAPYLVKLHKNHFFTNAVIQDGWGEGCGIFVRTAATLAELRKHLHGLLTVKDESGRKFVFRYYDPRVLRVYLPTCTADELDAVFGPADSFILEGADPSTLLQFRRNGGALEVEQKHLLNAFSAAALDDNLTP